MEEPDLVELIMGHVRQHVLAGVCFPGWWGARSVKLGSLDVHLEGVRGRI